MKNAISNSKVLWTLMVLAVAQGSLSAQGNSQYQGNSQFSRSAQEAMRNAGGKVASFFGGNEVAPKVTPKEVAKLEKMGISLDSVKQVVGDNILGAITFGATTYLIYRGASWCKNTDNETVVKLKDVASKWYSKVAGVAALGGAAYGAYANRCVLGSALNNPYAASAAAGLVGAQLVYDKTGSKVKAAGAALAVPAMTTAYNMGYFGKAASLIVSNTPEVVKSYFNSAYSGLVATPGYMLGLAKNNPKYAAGLATLAGTAFVAYKYAPMNRINGWTGLFGGSKVVPADAPEVKAEQQPYISDKKGLAWQNISGVWHYFDITNKKWVSQLNETQEQVIFCQPRLLVEIEQLEGVLQQPGLNSESKVVADHLTSISNTANVAEKPFAQTVAAMIEAVKVYLATPRENLNRRVNRSVMDAQIYALKNQLAPVLLQNAILPK